MKRFIFGIILLLVSYQLLRLGFLYNNLEQYLDISGWELGIAFFYGLRFDLASIAMINIPLALWYFIDPRSRLDRWTCLVQRSLFVIMNGIFIALNIIDLEYFQFTGRRLTLASFDIQTDIVRQVAPIMASYWPFTLVIILSIVLLVAISPLVITGNRAKKGYLGYALALLVALAALFLGARGGWQSKPLIAAHAYVDARPHYANLILNSSFTLLKSFSNESLRPVQYLSDWQTVEEVLRPFQGKAEARLIADFKSKKPNIVVLILESFSREYMGYQNPYPGYTPFLDELARRSYFFDQHFANGRRSIDAIPAIIAGIPAWMDRPFITSPYQTNRIEGLPQILSSQGYRSYFFHGGYSGTMFFDVMARLLGFDAYIDASSYPDSKDHDGVWGIFDEPFLQFVANKLDQSEQPFFTTVFTLSSHHPYRIPEQYQGRFPQGSLPIHEAVAYSDFALQQFFQRIQQSPWYSNTLFVITADHTSKSDQAAYQTLLGQFKVPLLFYYPAAALPFSKSNSVAQHIDIKPTILDLLGLKDSVGGLQGQSLVDGASNERLSLMFAGHVYLARTDSYLLRYTIADRQLEFFEINDEHFSNSLAIDSKVHDLWLKRIEAYIQLFQNGLIEDRLTWKSFDNL